MNSNEAETKVRKAAADLKSAILAARDAGLSVVWPARVADLDSIVVSETGKAKVTVSVEADVPPETADKAAKAAQKAADKVTGTS
ncbi:hypothetical protein [Jiella avicenniae]|uniref:Uncharacterized protein n=1 Tax=Jiella avicenniae TaxID=2907202 RepID=A0A9X1NZF9_9HYPH|nr:hypothetical protein [Jiella avicenniae]MCE7028477.1 hypothetical protein [Jiella avicenniae]